MCFSGSDALAWISEKINMSTANDEDKRIKTFSKYDCKKKSGNEENKNNNYRDCI